MSLQLYHGGPTANSAKALLTLAEKGVSYQSHLIDWEKFEQHSPAFLKINPRGQVPVLVHEGRVITESTVICAYVDEVFNGPKLQPIDPYWRAQMRIWTKFVDEYFCWCVSTLGWQYYVATLVEGKSEEEFEDLVSRVPLPEQRVKWRNARNGFDPAHLAEERRKILVSVARLEDDLAARRWLAGDTYSLADICAYAICISLPRVMPEALSDAATPCTLAWMAAVEARPATRAVFAEDTQPLARRAGR